MKRKLNLILAAAAVCLASCGGKPSEPEVTSYTVAITTSSLTIDKKEVKKGEDLSLTIALDESHPKTEYHLPETLTSVVVGSTTLGAGDYTYLKDSGALTIPAAKINGNIVITADAVKNPYKVYEVIFDASPYSFDPQLPDVKFKTVSVAEGTMFSAIELDKPQNAYDPDKKHSFEFTAWTKNGEIITKENDFPINSDGVIVKAKWDQIPNLYKIDVSGMENCSFMGQREYVEGGIGINATIVPFNDSASQTFYKCPETIQILIDDEELVGGYRYYRDPASMNYNLFIPDSLITGDIKIIAKAEKLTIFGAAYEYDGETKGYEVTRYVLNPYNPPKEILKMEDFYDGPQGSAKITSIRSNCFNHMYSEKMDPLHIIFPVGLKKIGDSPFTSFSIKATKDDPFIIPETVEIIGSHAFVAENTSQDGSWVYLPYRDEAEVKEMIAEGLVDKDWDKLNTDQAIINKYYYGDAGKMDVSYNVDTRTYQVNGLNINSNEETEIIIPELYVDYSKLSSEYSRGALPLSVIGSEAFYDQTTVSKYIIPKSVTSIGSKAFGYSASSTNQPIAIDFTSFDENSVVPTVTDDSFDTPNGEVTITLHFKTEAICNCFKNSSAWKDKAFLNKVKYSWGTGD